MARILLAFTAPISAPATARARLPATRTSTISRTRLARRSVPFPAPFLVRQNSTFSPACQALNQSTHRFLKIIDSIDFLDTYTDRFSRFSRYIDQSVFSIVSIPKFPRFIRFLDQSGSRQEKAHGFPCAVALCHKCQRSHERTSRFFIYR